MLDRGSTSQYNLAVPANGRRAGYCREDSPSKRFWCEAEASGDTATVKCHGRVLMDTAPELKELVKPMIPKYRRIVLDLHDVLSWTAQGSALVSLKSAANATDNKCPRRIRTCLLN